MTQKLFLIITFALGIHFLLASCVGNKTDCKGKFEKATLQVSSKRSNLGFYNPMDTFLIVPFDSLSLRSEISGSIFDCVKNTSPSFLIQTANAWQFPTQDVTISQRITSIDYVTLRNYNSTHGQGASLNDILVHTTDDYSISSANQSNSQLVATLNTALNKPLFGAAQLVHYSYLTDPPVNTLDTVEIEIVYNFDNGVVLKDTCPTFKVVF